MITKQINIEGIEQNRYDALVLLADNSLRGELYTVDEEGNEVGQRLYNVVFVEPWLFELTEEELSELNPIADAPQL